MRADRYPGIARAAAWLKAKSFIIMLIMNDD
jgi:hypothetical protein